jgi:hypothetical protein
MFSLQRIALPVLVLITQVHAYAQTPTTAASLLADAKLFMSSYAEDLSGGKRESLINRYDPRGYYRVGQGIKILKSLEDTRTAYLGKWRPPVSFTWRDLSYEVIGLDAVVVTGLFDWGTSSGMKMTASYTALLVNQNGSLKIRLEDESWALPSSTAKP